MPNKYYIRGAKWERKVKQMFIDEGFEIVERTAGSHGMFDVFALKDTGKVKYEAWIAVYVQCKAYDSKEKK